MEAAASSPPPPPRCVAVRGGRGRGWSDWRWRGEAGKEEREEVRRWRVKRRLTEGMGGNYKEGNKKWGDLR